MDEDSFLGIYEPYEWRSPFCEGTTMWRFSWKRIGADGDKPRYVFGDFGYWYIGSSNENPYGGIAVARDLADTSNPNTVDGNYSAIETSGEEFNGVPEGSGCDFIVDNVSCPATTTSSTSPPELQCSRCIIVSGHPDGQQFDGGYHAVAGSGPIAGAGTHNGSPVWVRRHGTLEEMEGFEEGTFIFIATWIYLNDSGEWVMSGGAYSDVDNRFNGENQDGSTSYKGSTGTCPYDATWEEGITVEEGFEDEDGNCVDEKNEYIYLGVSCQQTGGENLEIEFEPGVYTRGELLSEGAVFDLICVGGQDETNGICVKDITEVDADGRKVDCYANVMWESCKLCVDDDNVRVFVARKCSDDSVIHFVNLAFPESNYNEDGSIKDLFLDDYNPRQVDAGLSTNKGEKTGVIITVDGEDQCYDNIIELGYFDELGLGETEAWNPATKVYTFKSYSECIWSYASLPRRQPLVSWSSTV